jgi:translation initiation factor IF-2
VAGSKVASGVMEKKGKIRVIRNEKVIADDLRISSLKKF